MAIGHLFGLLPVPVVRWIPARDLCKAPSALCGASPLPLPSTHGIVNYGWTGGGAGRNSAARRNLRTARLFHLRLEGEGGAGIAPFGAVQEVHVVVGQRRGHDAGHQRRRLFPQAVGQHTLLARLFQD